MNLQPRYPRIIQGFLTFFCFWPFGVARADPPILKLETLKEHSTPSIFVLLPVTILMRKEPE